MMPAHARQTASCPNSTGVVIATGKADKSAVQCRMQLGADAGYTSTRECLRRTLQQEGWAGLSRGLSGTLARETPGNAIFFPVYEVWSSVARKHCMHCNAFAFVSCQL